MYDVKETHQTDVVTLNNLDAQGDLHGTLYSDKFVGMDMASGVAIFGEGSYSGVEYAGLELITFNLGDGVDLLTVENTSEAIHVMNLAKGNDNVTVKSLSGPLLVNGEEGTDTFVVSSDENMIDQVNALLSFDGGEMDEQDTLLVDNSGDLSGVDDVVNVTRLLMEFYSMEAPDLDFIGNGTNLTDNETNPVIDVTNSFPRESYIFTLRNATSGSIKISLDDPSTNRTRNNLSRTITYPTNATFLQDIINTMLIPKNEMKTCGKRGDSACAPSVFVYQRGSSGESQTFVVFFVGERLNANVNLFLDTSELDDFYTESSSIKRMTSS